MRASLFITRSGAAAMLLGAWILPASVSAQQRDDSRPSAPQPVYNPYPPGLLPPDLESEIARVVREVDFIFARTLAEWKATPPPTVTGNPPSLQGSGMRLVQLLGKLELFDRTISVNENLACSSCHMPYAGFSGPIPSVNLSMGQYPGSVLFRFGKRKPQSYTYSPFYPALDFNQTQQDFYGGNFWDLRATGYKLQSADADQAQHPVLDTQEHGFPDAACIVFAVSRSPYRPLFEQIWGKQAFDIRWPPHTAEICRTPGGAAILHGDPTPIPLSRLDRGRATAAFDQFALSITAYERSEDVSAFSSKFDAFLKGNAHRAISGSPETPGIRSTSRTSQTRSGSPPIPRARRSPIWEWACSCEAKPGGSTRTRPGHRWRPSSTARCRCPRSAMSTCGRVPVS